MTDRPLIAPLDPDRPPDVRWVDFHCPAAPAGRVCVHWLVARSQFARCPYCLACYSEHEERSDEFALAVELDDIGGD